MAELTAQTVNLQTHGGPMQAQLVLPAGEAKVGAVIVVPEAFGVTAGIVADCKQFAAAGYIALGIEIYHRTAPAGFVSAKFDFKEVLPHFKAVTNDGLAEDIAAARDFLKMHPRSSGKVGIVGYCIGGFVAYLGACRSGLAASVVYYGGGIVHARPQLSSLTPLLEETPACPVLGQFGENDESIPKADRDAIEAALSKAGVEHEVNAYPGAGHAFSNPERPAYNAEASLAAWKKTEAFLAKHLG